MPTNQPLKQVGPGIFQLGDVRLDNRRKTVRFPAVVNMTEATIEYAVVTSMGKTHESLLKTAAEPYHIHLALLLIGARPSGTNQLADEGAIPGEPVQIAVNWKADGADRQCAIEDLVYNTRTRSSPARGDWVFNGSNLSEGTFVAQRDGSIVSLITDADALINNPRPGRENDDIWQVNTNASPPLPALDSAVEVIIRLHTNSVDTAAPTEAPAAEPKKP